MAKSSGLAAGLLAGVFDVSGDTGAVTALEYGTGQLDVTGIDKSAMERLHGVRFGRIGWRSFFNDAAGAAHAALNSLPDADTTVTYMHRRTLGAPTFSMQSKRTGYDGSRAADGMFTFDVEAVANKFGLDMGHLLTAGVATSTGAESLTGFDDGAGAATAFGLQAFLHVTAFTGTSATVTIEDAASIGGPYTAVPAAAFAAVTGAITERIETSRTETVDEFLRVTITGTYTNLVFAVSAQPNRYITVNF